jgi:hypothetical protein
LAKLINDAMPREDMAVRKPKGDSRSMLPRTEREELHRRKPVFAMLRRDGE